MEILQQYLPAAGEADSTGTNIKYTETTSTQIEAKEMYASVKKYMGHNNKMDKKYIKSRHRRKNIYSR